MDPVIVGAAGMLFIVAGWISSYGQRPPLRLSLLYTVGSLLLLLYSIMRGDPVFTLLNLLATVSSSYHAFIGLMERRHP